MRCVSFVKRRRRRRRRRSLLPCSHVGWRGYEEGRTRTRRDEKQGGNGGRRDGLGWREGNPEGGTSREKERGRGGGRQMRRRRGRSPPPLFPSHSSRPVFLPPFPPTPFSFPYAPSLPLSQPPSRSLSHATLALSRTISFPPRTPPSLPLPPPAFPVSLSHSLTCKLPQSLTLPPFTNLMRPPSPLLARSARARVLRHSNTRSLPFLSLPFTPVLFLSSLSHSGDESIVARIPRRKTRRRCPSGLNPKP